MPAPQDVEKEVGKQIVGYLAKTPQAVAVLFCSFTVLSRKPPTEQEFYEGYRQYKDSYYRPKDEKEIAE